MNKILIPISIMIAGLLVAGALVYINQGKIEQLTSEEEAAAFQKIAEKAINYINENKDALTGGYDASLVSVEEEGDILKIRLKVAEQEYDSYVTKDGKFLFPGGYNLEETQEGASAEEGTTPETQKRDAPDVKVFVMSYCPYGLQAQKMFLPVYDLLKDKAEMGVYFVDYIMHEKQEIDENLRQYCIQKEQKEKYYDYLMCFVVDDNSEECLSQANIDKTELAACISATDQEYNITGQYNDKSTWLNGYYPKFDVHADLNNKYGVQGSPTVVINDEIVNLSSRSPEKFKEAVCQAFNTPPSECNQTLSDAAFSPGFGLETGSSSGGQCQ
jgi:protein-disulfide isomerase